MRQNKKRIEIKKKKPYERVVTGRSLVFMYDVD